MRFSLQSILLSFVVVWSSLAAFGLGGLAVALIALTLAANVRRPGIVGLSREARAYVIFFSVAGLLFFLLATPRVNTGSHPRTCRNNVQQIALALHNYHTAYGSFPPAYIADSEGRPMHSWRVLVLPGLGRQDLYNQYDFNESWDGPNNRKLIPRMPDVFRCPDDQEPGATWTNFVAVVGADTAWPGETPRRDVEFVGGLSGTILVAELADSDISWTEPRDLSFDAARRGVNAERGNSISGRHKEPRRFFVTETWNAHVGMADGSYRVLGEGTSPETLEAMLSINGAATASFRGGTRQQIHPRWDRVVALLVLFVSSLLLVLRPNRTVRRASEPVGT